VKYAETCECGVVLKVTSDDPMMFARVKGRWKLDHEDHSLDRLRSKRKKVVVEIDLLNQLITELTLKAEDAEKRLALITPITPPASMHAYSQNLYDMSPSDTPFLKISADQQAAAMGVISEQSALERNFGDWEEKGFPPGDQSDAVMAAWHEAIKAKITRGDENSEQGKQIQGEGDEGAATPKGNATSRWPLNYRLGRRRNQRQG